METRLGYYSVMQMRYHLDYLMDYYLANSMVNWMEKNLVNSTGMTMDCLMVTNSVTTTDSMMETMMVNLTATPMATNSPRHWGCYSGNYSGSTTG